MSVAIRHSVLLAVGVVWTASQTYSFNLEPRTGQIFSYPFRKTEGRNAYFGFSVALQHSEATNGNWLMVGAPRANSSKYTNTKEITEPGALFKCDLSDGKCAEVIVDPSGNTDMPNPISKYSYHDHKNHGWLGGSLDIQPQWREGRQMTGVCAPRWKNQVTYNRERSLYMIGACYWFDGASTTLNVKKELPLVNHDELTKEIQGDYYYNYAHGEAGISLHFADDQTSFLIGAPGVFNWHGTVILYEDKRWNVPIDARRKRQIRRQNQHFTHSLVPDSSYFSSVDNCDLFGYAVTSGRFMSQKKILYVGSAPRGADSYGKVIVFDFPSREQSDLLIKKEFKGEQLGEYFGGSLTVADINGDKLSDLVVGSPTYSLSNTPDVGRIWTFLSSNGIGLNVHSEPYYGNKVHLARFGTTLASPGDLNGDGYEDIIVGAPWEDDGAVYVFMGSSIGLKRQYSQRLSPKDFAPGLKGFGMSVSRGVDVDRNGYPDLAIGSFLSGHAVMVKSRPVATVSGYFRANPPNVPWGGSSRLTLTTCFNYGGKSVPRRSYIQVKVTLDYNNPIPRAVFDNKQFVRTFTEQLIANSHQPTCIDHQVTVNDDKMDPDQPITMKMEYNLVNRSDLDLIKRPVIDPNELYSNTVRVSILKDCPEKICRINLIFDADLDLGPQNKLVVGQKNLPVLRVKVSNNDDPAYLPIMVVKVDHPLALLLPPSHDCKFHDNDLRTTVECRLSNPIRKNKPDTVDVTVDVSQLSDGSSNPEIHVNVSGQGEELTPNDNKLSMGLQLEAHAYLSLHGTSKEEQVFYKQLKDERINATINPRFTHTYVIVKEGPTPLGHVDLNIDIPVNITGQKFIKLYPPKTDFLQQSFYCSLKNMSFDVDINDIVNQDSIKSTSNEESRKSPSREVSIKEVIVDAGKKKGPQYFNCSSNLIECARLSCHVPNWPADTGTAKIFLDVEIDLSVLAKHMSLKSGAVFSSNGTASIQSINSLLIFVGEKLASRDVVTQIQPDTLQTKGIPWWVILLAVLGGLLLLGLMAYGMHKAGFFKREKMEELKVQRANLVSSENYGTANNGMVGD